MQQRSSTAWRAGIRERLGHSRAGPVSAAVCMFRGGVGCSHSIWRTACSCPTGCLNATPVPLGVWLPCVHAMRLVLPATVTYCEHAALQYTHACVPQQGGQHAAASDGLQPH
jgi:hypothetical protein